MCGAANLKFHLAWGKDLDAASMAIRQYYLSHGGLPAQLEEALSEAGLSMKHSPMIQYRKEGDNTFLLWMRCQDVERASKEKETLSATPGGPDNDDVWARYDAGGKLLDLSWKRQE
jgi:hypothetical protein